MKRLNLGCGGDYRPGWVNIDSDSRLQTDLCIDISCLPYDNDTVDEIFACHVLEHLPLTEEDPIGEWHRVLKPGGLINIAIPDLIKGHECHLAGLWSARVFTDTIFGLQDQGEGMKHRQALSGAMLMARMLPYFPDVEEVRVGAGRHVTEGDGETMMQAHKEGVWLES